MNKKTTTDKIIEQLKSNLYINLESLRNQLNTLFEQERTADRGEQPKIDLNLKEIESIVQELAHHHAKEYVNRYGAVHKELVDGYRSRIGYKIEDLTQE